MNILKNPKLKTKISRQFRLNRSFTIIEILVVIAIIAVLAGIILANVNDIKKRSRDVSIKANMKLYISAAGMYYGDNGTYYIDIDNNVCTGSEFTKIKDALTSLNAVGTSFTCASISEKWVVCGAGPLGNASYFCVDYLGDMMETISNPALCMMIIKNTKKCQ